MGACVRVTPLSIGLLLVAYYLSSLVPHVVRTPCSRSFRHGHFLKPQNKKRVGFLRPTPQPSRPLFLHTRSRDKLITKRSCHPNLLETPKGRPRSRRASVPRWPPLRASACCGRRAPARELRVLCSMLLVLFQARFSSSFAAFLSLWVSLVAAVVMASCSHQSRYSSPPSNRVPKNTCQGAVLF